MHRSVMNTQHENQRGSRRFFCKVIMRDNTFGIFGVVFNQIALKVREVKSMCTDILIIRFLCGIPTCVFF